ncbi:dirigent protein 23-like [Cryptomeria japonica]|uniref:dirigent protein 23-like n=1 Tax=Cryptomeria japonica TaxID=3369 RepID=UPI0027DA9C1E|nr:dirigent protein 23-like [Cryptomeria japonica]
MQFYFHDKVSGQNVTAVEVTHSPSTKSSPTFFRSVVVIDDLLTEGLEPTSKLLGRAQGLYALASQEDLQLLMAVTYVFQSGEFNGSTLAVVGHNAVFNEVREMRDVQDGSRIRPRTHTLLRHQGWECDCPL